MFKNNPYMGALGSANVNASSDKLTLACKTKDVNYVRQAINQGAQPDPFSLDWAISSGNDEIVHLVASVGAKPTNATLNLACETRNLAIVKTAIMSGAKPAVDTYTKSIITGNQEILNLVNSSGALPDNDSLDASLNYMPHISAWLINTFKIVPKQGNLTQACRIIDKSIRHNTIYAVIVAGGLPDDYTLAAFMGSCRHDSGVINRNLFNSLIEKLSDLGRFDNANAIWNIGVDIIMQDFKPNSENLDAAGYFSGLFKLGIPLNTQQGIRTHFIRVINNFQRDLSSCSPRDYQNVNEYKENIRKLNAAYEIFNAMCDVNNKTEMVSSTKRDGQRSRNSCRIS